MKKKLIDEQWDHLMDLCQREKELEGGNHARLLRLIGKEIDRLATEMGFAPRTEPMATLCTRFERRINRAISRARARS